MKHKLFIMIMVLVFSVAPVAGILQAQSLPASGAALTAKQGHIAMIAAFTAKGDLKNLKPALQAGLDGGLTINEIKEVLVQMYAYCGFPRSLNGIGLFMEVLEERKSKGIIDEIGKAATAVSEKNSVELGTQIQTKLLGGVPLTGALYSFSPEIDRFLKGHLFGDIFGRGILDFSQREVATIAALSSMTGVSPQRQAHIKIGRQNGLSDQQLRELAELIAVKVGLAEGDNAAGALHKVLHPQEAMGLAAVIPSGGEMKLYPKGSQGTFAGAPQFFTGKVQVDMVAPANEENSYSAAYVTFSPGARTAWHKHPAGQSLLVVKGVCWTQTWDGVKKTAYPGDAIWCPPGVKHWHGAAPEEEMMHLALTGSKDGKNVEWLEHVTDQQYYSPGL